MPSVMPVPENKPIAHFSDLEKNELQEGKKARSSRISDLLVFIIFVLLVGGFINLSITFGSRGGESLNTERPQVPGLVYSFRKVMNQVDPDRSEFAISSSIGSESDGGEWEKYINEAELHGQKSAKKPDSDKSMHMSNPQVDLREILSVTSIILLTDDENTQEQQEATRILETVKIHPEVKHVKLSRHPHYKEIVAYLKKFSLKKQSSQTYNEYSKTLATNPHIHKVPGDDKTEKDIPRLFIGGLPIADYHDIITKHTNNDLHSFLREAGEGFINILID